MNSTSSVVLLDVCRNVVSRSALNFVFKILTLTGSVPPGRQATSMPCRVLQRQRQHQRL